jgi:hypothetical protein
MTNSSGVGNADGGQAVLQAVSQSLVRRGYLTTEWWTTIVGGALSAVLALIHINASSATHVVAVAAPALLAALYALTRTMHKSALASALADVFPQAGGADTAAPPTGQPPPGAPADQVAAAPVAQTSSDFAFVGTDWGN